MADLAYRDDNDYRNDTVLNRDHRTRQLGGDLGWRVYVFGDLGGFWSPGARDIRGHANPNAAMPVTGQSTGIAIWSHFCRSAIAE